MIYDINLAMLLLITSYVAIDHVIRKCTDWNVNYD